MTRLTDARLAELAAFCGEMADTRRELQPWADLGWVCEEMIEWRRMAREVEDYLAALPAVIRSGDTAALERMTENGKRAGR